LTFINCRRHQGGIWSPAAVVSGCGPLDDHPVRRSGSSEPVLQERGMEIVYFTLAGIALYLFADWLLDRIEQARGRRFEQRALVFFAILLALAVGTFQLIQYLAGETG
jgi:MFS family permease